MTQITPDNIPQPDGTSGGPLGGGSTSVPGSIPLGGDDLNPPFIPDEEPKEDGPNPPAYPGVDPQPETPGNGPKLEDDQGKNRDSFVGTHQIGGDNA